MIQLKALLLFPLSNSMVFFPSSFLQLLTLFSSYVFPPSSWTLAQSPLGFLLHLTPYVTPKGVLIFLNSGHRHLEVLKGGKEV